MHACMDMNWDPVMFAPSGAHLGLSADEHLLALVGRVKGVGAGGAKVVVGDDFHDVWRTEFGDSAVVGEGIMVRLESFKSAQGAGAFGRLGVPGG